MDPSVVIRIENLGKSYVIRHRNQSEDDGMRHAVQDLVEAPIRALRRWRRGEPVRGSTKEDFWALRDVSFDVRQGEVVGIIGRNGAGKSTLLKLLSRITEPTTGRIGIKGRVASLLEVGTGFHPELTGRENIFLNGAILGMTRREVRDRFDEIIDFAGVERFLDTPVKRYSSGMTVRLAFAVAAHLEPEILVVDEVLAVGDADFQRRCLGKMKEVSAKGGRTVLFVSHNMGMITSLCQRAIVLAGGSVEADTTAADGVRIYYNSGKHTGSQAQFSGKTLPGNDSAKLISARIENADGHGIAESDVRQPFQVRMRYRVLRPAAKAPYPNFHVTDSGGNYVFVSSPPANQQGQHPGEFEAICRIPGDLLNNGIYYIGVALTFMDRGMDVAFFERDALCINIIDPIDETVDGDRNGYSGVIPGPVRPRLGWSVNQIK